MVLVLLWKYTSLVQDRRKYNRRQRTDKSQYYMQTRGLLFLSKFMTEKNENEENIELIGDSEADDKTA
ncbi:unnamed protein product [Macrosiphum euphorbiae]|uniref:Uncharacterized protein n=1 Tax=Macrosiphum euphorbiae TaxID=13131 RepID=A0AAV0W2N5_9HEMI|nr:unnamed protein product [Macrosiphum euphorbiae]